MELGFRVGFQMLLTGCSYGANFGKILFEDVRIWFASAKI